MQSSKRYTKITQLRVHIDVEYKDIYDFYSVDQKYHNFSL